MLPRRVSISRSCHMSSPGMEPETNILPKPPKAGPGELRKWPVITDPQPAMDSRLPFPAPHHEDRTGSQKPSTITEEEHRANAEFLSGAYAPNTGIAYRSQLRAWTGWCIQRGLSPVDADVDTLASYIRERAEGIAIGDRFHRPAKPNSLNVACAATSKAYEIASLPDITKHARVREALRSHRYRVARAGVRVRQAEALTSENMAAIRVTALLPRRGRGGVETEGQARRRGLVDIALVGLMRDCMLRRSEAAEVRWSHITSHADGTGRLFVGVSKTDQEGEGTLLFVSSQTMRDLSALGPDGGGDRLVFGLHPRSIGRRIAAAAHAGGGMGAYSGHSARVGMARDLARAGEELPALMTEGRWKGPEMVARYIAHERAERGAVARYHREPQTL